MLTVVFDESHAETWSINPFTAFATDAGKPEYYSYEHLATLLEGTLGCRVRRNTSAPVTRRTLEGIAALTIVHPADRTVHRGVLGDPVFSPEEVRAIAEYVERGGALFVLYEYRADQWKSNINELIGAFGLRFNNDVAAEAIAMPSGVYEASQFTTCTFGDHPVTRGLERISFLAGCTVDVSSAPGSGVIFTTSGAPLAAAVQFGRGRVAVIGDSDIFAIPYIRQHDNIRLFLNIYEWLTTGGEPTRPAIRGFDFVKARRPSIFLSYARADYEHVKNLYDALKTLGFDPWLDKESLFGGQRFEDAITRAIQDSDFFVPCFSENSVNRRGMIQRELRLALNVAEEYLDDDIYIIPVRLAPVSIGQRFSSIQWIDLFAEDGFARLIAALRRGVATRGAAGSAAYTDQGG